MIDRFDTSRHQQDSGEMPRERFLSAVERRPTGGVSLDLGYGIASYTLGAHRALCDVLGIANPSSIVSARMLNIVYPDARIQQCCCGDVRFLASGPLPSGSEDVDLDDRTYRDEWNLTRRLSAGGLYYDFVDAPLEGCRTLDECLKRLRRPQGATPRALGMREQAETYRSQGYAVGAWCFAGIFEMVFWLRGYRQAYLDFGARPKIAAGLMDALLEIQIDFWSAILKETDGLLDVALLTEDLGIQTALMISEQQFREIVKPRIGELIRHIKGMSPNTKLLLHSDGAVFPLIGDFIEMGVDILNPVQPGATGMNPRLIKKEFGDDLSFHGAIDIQDLLRSETPQTVRASIHKVVELLGKNGGYVVAPAHCVQPDVPPENILALVDAVRELAEYP